MTIYSKAVNYRKIYEDHFGPIPVDENNRTYEVHHIDGNRDNNDISNLIAVSLQEHYDIHFAQGDYDACRLMKIQRMNHTPDELAQLNSKSKRGKTTVKHAVTGEVFGTMSITDERYLSREYVHVSTGLTIPQAKKVCQYCLVIFPVNTLKKHERSCNSNPRKTHSTYKVSFKNCCHCNLAVAATNIKKHEQSCDANPDKVAGINSGKSYLKTKRVCVFCSKLIGSTRYAVHEKSCDLNPNRVDYPNKNTPHKFTKLSK